MAIATYEVFAVKYAERDARRPDNFVGGDPHDVPMPMDYFIWLIRNDERLVLVDTGFDAPMAAKRGRRLLRTPKAALALLGVEAEEVRTVVMLERYPAATPELEGIAVRLDAEPARA